MRNKYWRLLGIVFLASWYGAFIFHPSAKILPFVLTTQGNTFVFFILAFSYIMLNLVKWFLIVGAIPIAISFFTGWFDKEIMNKEPWED